MKALVACRVRALVAAVVLGIVTVLLVNLSDVESAHARPLDEVSESGTIRIAVYRDFPPFSEVDGGNFRGVDVDIGRAIAAQLDLRPNFMAVTAGETVDDDLRNAVWKGHYLGGGVADLMLHVPIDRRFAMRNNHVMLFGAYARMQLVQASDRRAGDAAVDLADIGDRKVAVEIATLGDYYLVSAFGGQLRDNVVHYSSAISGVQALRDGEVAVALASRTEMEAGLGARRDDFTLNPVAIPGASWLIGAAVDEYSRDLGYTVADLLAAMVVDGSMARIFAEHGLSYTPPDSE